MRGALVFVYGTLTDPDRVDAVVDEWSFEGSARLVGLRRADGEYPTLVPARAGDAGGATGNRGGETGVQGRLLRTPDLAALDSYEGVDRGLYVRVTVPVAGHDEGAVVYVGAPGKLGVDVTWPGEGALADRVGRYVDEEQVVVRSIGD